MREQLEAYLKDIVHGEGNLEAGVVWRFHSDGVRDEVGTKHQANGDQRSYFLGLTS